MKYLPWLVKSTLSHFKSVPVKVFARSISSHDWLKRQKKDPYVKKAKYVSYRARSAFKLIEMDEKYHIFKPGQVVIDIGAAPGSWCQVAVAKVNAEILEDISTPGTDPQIVITDSNPAEQNRELQDWSSENRKAQQQSSHFPTRNYGSVIGVDLLPIDPLRGAILLGESDFTSVKTYQKIVKLLQGREVDVVLSDMAPNATGIHQMDHDLIVDLCKVAFEFSKKVLKQNGIFLCKIWAGRDQAVLLENFKKSFESVRFVKPPASRGDSAELYILAMKYKRLLIN